MHWRNLNTETEKSEQTEFAPISLSQYKEFYTVYALTRFKNCNTNMDRAEHLSFLYITPPGNLNSCCCNIFNFLKSLSACFKEPGFSNSLNLPFDGRRLAPCVKVFIALIPANAPSEKK